MPIDLTFLALALIVVAAFAVETVTGFGPMIIGLGLGTFFYPLSALLPILVLLDTLVCGYLALRHRGTIDVRWLVGRLLPLMTAGVAFGLFIALHAPETLLQRLLGMVVLIIAVVELVVLVRTPRARPPLSASFRVIGLLGAGVMHGIFATGGPLLVYVLSRSELGKSAFRSTLMMVWVLLDLLLLTTYAAAGRIERATLVASVLLLPALMVAVAVGESVHRRLDERRFRIVVMSLLLIVGVTLLI
jgi:uncharacterized membrane protein YfcA